MNKHPGFKKVAASIAKKGYSQQSANAILASASRKASPKAKAKNPRLKRVTAGQARKMPLAKLEGRLG